MEKIIKKLTGLEADDILKLLTFDEVPDGHREEVWIGESGTNYFVGNEGILSEDGEIILNVEKKRIHFKGRGKTERPMCPHCQQDLKRSYETAPDWKKGKVPYGWHCKACKYQTFD